MTDDHEPVFPFIGDAAFEAWKRQLAQLPPTGVSIREATAVPDDGLRVRYLQFACSPLGIDSVDKNLQMIREHRVDIAEVDGVHIGFCVSAVGAQTADPMFLQLLGVAPEVRRRGVGLALLSTAAQRHPALDIAFATRDDNVAARSACERLAVSIGATIRRVPLKTYRNQDLLIRTGLGYRSWVIERQRTAYSKANARGEPPYTDGC